MKARSFLVVAMFFSGVLGSFIASRTMAVAAAVPPKLFVRELVLVDGIISQS
jgi:hypothetical protein